MQTDVTSKRTLTPGHRAAISASMKRRFSDPAQRALMSDRTRAVWTARKLIAVESLSRAEYARLHRYRMTPDGFDAMLARQKGRCGICSRQLQLRRGGVAVDHDHTTGEVRGLLCMPCNTSLGWYEKQGHMRIAAYLTCEIKCKGET